MPTVTPASPRSTDAATDAATGEDVVALLIRQHREVESVMQSLLDADGTTARRALLERASDDLAVHISAEEFVFYPAVRAARTEDILLESLEEHLSLKRLLADLLVLSPEEVTFIPKCKVLEEQARHHHKEEEEHLFPSVLQLLSSEERVRLGQDVAQHEQQLRMQGAPRHGIGSETKAAVPLN